jgi:hypothetical protein
VIAGVPGAGISAFFYLLAVLAMPLVALYRVVRARSLAAGQWRLVARQTAVALGIGGGLLLGGAAVTWVVTSAAQSASVEQTTQVVWQAGDTLSRLGIALGVATLLLVLGSVQLAALIAGRGARGRANGVERG